MLGSRVSEGSPLISEAAVAVRWRPKQLIHNAAALTFQLRRPINKLHSCLQQPKCNGDRMRCTLKHNSAGCKAR